MFQSNQTSRAVRELKDVVFHWAIWTSLAQADIRSKYRLSTFGSLWITFTTGALALAIGLFYGQFFGQNMHAYLPYFIASYIIWTFIASVIGEASVSLVGAGNLIKSSQMPVIFHVLRMLHRNMIVALHNVIVLAAIWPFVRWPIHASAFLSLAGVVLLYLFLMGAGVVIAIICVRYRDVVPLIQVIIQFLFFLTPVIWYPEQVRLGTVVLKLNPVAYMLVVVRDPVLGRPVDVETWIVAVILTVISISAGSFLYARFRHRIAFWV